MCILRYTPISEPSASITAAVLWYTPAARRSNSDAMITALYFFASLLNASVDGPGMVSASAKKRWSSTWQKYCERNSSCVEKIFAPLFSAFSTRASWLARFFWGSSPHAICERPTLTIVDAGIRPFYEVLGSFMSTLRHDAGETPSRQTPVSPDAALTGPVASAPDTGAPPARAGLRLACWSTDSH